MEKKNKYRIKDKGCLHCEYLVECEGKPLGVEKCVEYKERKDNGRIK